jgi:two-component system, cell cycle response regulator
MTEASKVLIVDDEPIARESLDALLAGEDYQLFFAASGVEGLELASALKPDAVLLDVMMPGMDGFEVCRRLRADVDLEQVAIIMITALDDRASRLAGLRAGADEFLSKPFDSVELKTRLQTIARLGRYRRLLAERTRVEWMVEESEDGYVLLDATGKIRFANPRGRSYLNLPEDVVGQDFMDTARLCFRLEPIAAWEQWKTDGVSSAPCYLVQPETFTARAFWLQAEVLGGAYVSDLGRMLRLRDVTSQMSNYQDMRRFHTTVVHKLRTPLIAMHGSFTLLANYGSDMPGTEVEEFAHTALLGIERLKSEIDDILQYINAPVLALSGETMKIAAFRTRVVALGEQLGITHLTVTIEDGLDDLLLPLTPQALDTIAWELLENSVKFHPTKNPHIEVSIRLQNGDALCLQIRDDGVTLSADQLRSVWTPYIQGEKYFTGEAPGMGLGLPLVATLVWQVGGEARLANRTDGSGIDVVLTMPLLDVL